MKRLNIAFASLLLGASILVAGCGNTNTANIEDQNFPTTKDSRPDEEKQAEFVTLNGNLVTYNQNTRKIVCTFGSQDIVSFGIPVLAYEASTDITGFESYYLGATALVHSSPISVEEVMRYEPELIFVAEKTDASTVKSLSEVAPVIPLYTESTDFKKRLSYIGDIFGMKEEANRLIDYADSLKTNMVSRIKSLGLAEKTVTLFTYMGGISIPPERGWFMNTIIYDYCAMKRLASVEAFMTDESVIAYNTISSEKLKDYEGDLVIYAGFGESTISSYVSENPGWKNLDAVKENRVGIIDITAYQQKGVLLLYGQYQRIYEALKVAGNVH